MAARKTPNPRSASKPGAVRVSQRLDLAKIVNRLATDAKIGKSIQKAVFDRATETYQHAYEKAYRSLVHQIIQHLQNGFPGADHRNPNVHISVENPFGGPDGGFTAQGWKPLSAAYRYDKRRAFNSLNGPYQSAQSKYEKARAQKKKAIKNSLRAPEDNSTKFWIFRRNLANAALSSSELNVQRATVQLIKNSVKKQGVLVRGKNKATIRYSVGLRFGKFPQPFDDLVRKPFITGMKEKSRVWDSSPGPSMRKGVRVIAYVEAKRPFIVDLSASVGRLVRHRLKI